MDKLDEDVFEMMRQSEAVVTHDVDVKKLIVELSEKVKEYEEAKENNEKEKLKELFEWEKCFRCVIFVVKKDNYNEIQIMHKRSFFAHNKLTAPPKKIDDPFQHFKNELKTWAQIDLDSLMYHISQLEESNLAYLKASLPEILQKVEQEHLEQKETMQRLENDGASTKIQEEKDRQAKITEERKKKVVEFKADEKFKDQSFVSVVGQLVSKRSEDKDETPLECDIYNILDCKKEHMEPIDKLI